MPFINTLIVSFVQCSVCINNIYIYIYMNSLYKKVIKKMMNGNPVIN